MNSGRPDESLEQLFDCLRVLGRVRRAAPMPPEDLARLVDDETIYTEILAASGTRPCA